MENNIYNPHLRTPKTTSSIMRDVCIALTPALLGAIYFFGFNALLITAVSVATCVLSEFVWTKLHKLPTTVSDFSAVVTGMLLAFNLSSTTPLWAVIIADIFAIIVVKQLFGGIGSNVFNPALMGRLFLMLFFPTAMMNYVAPTGVDAASTATILSGGKAFTLFDAFIGRVSGALGETSALLLLIGFGYLVYKKEVNYVVTLTYFVTVAIFSLILGENPLMQLCSGGLVLGGCYMLTDYKLSNNHGHALIGLCAGIITMAIRAWGTYPEGVCFAILLVNCFAPLIGNIKSKHVYGID